MRLSSGMWCQVCVRSGRPCSHTPSPRGGQPQHSLVGNGPRRVRCYRYPTASAEGRPKSRWGKEAPGDISLKTKQLKSNCTEFGKDAARGSNQGNREEGGPKVKAPSRPPKGGAAAVSPEALGAFRLGEGLGAEGPALEVGAGKSQRASHLTSLE